MSKKLILAFSQSTPQCAPADFACATSCTWSARRSSISWWNFVRRSRRGRGERQHSFAEKDPIFIIFRPPDQEHFGQGLQSVLWQQTLRARHPRIVAVPLQKLHTLQGRAVVLKSMPDFKVSPKRVKVLYMVDKLGSRLLLILKLTSN